MPELGPYGSVRGALSNERPYRDLGAPLSKQYQSLVMEARTKCLRCDFVSALCPKNRPARWRKRPTRPLRDRGETTS